ncbi:hypothetical protein [Microbulbifer sp. A4B17]|uniref:hypothetical protein n=1 Tax=Microbulbifer sp. A4B17 TaxID=359370 RepID=UPI0013005D1D|nr:hypothetical protein [Microbulbifer sp. A4B17]
MSETVNKRRLPDNRDVASLLKTPGCRSCGRYILGAIMRYLFSLSFILYALSASSNELEKILESWSLSKTPVEIIENIKRQDRDPESYEDLRIKWDRHVVYKSDGKLKLKIERNPHSSTELEIGEFLYRSIDKGEFGGELGYTYRGEYFPLLEGNVRKLILYGEKLYILEGLDHMMSRGVVYVIPDAENPSHPERVTLLPEAPNEALITDDGFLLIVGDNGLYFVSDDFFSILYWNAFWSGIYLWGPTSVVEYTDKYLIGLPKGVAVVELISPFEPPKIELYMTNEFNKSIQPTAKASAD